MDGRSTLAAKGRARPAARGILLALALAGVVVAAAGCGGKPSPSIASLGTTTSAATTTSASPTGNGGGAGIATGGGTPTLHTGFAIAGASASKMMALSACMRSHGVPNFPDPNAEGVISGSGIDPTSPQFQHAMTACAAIAGIHHAAPTPAQIQQQRAQALAYAACMRSHGVPNYPDPQFGSGGQISFSLHGGPGSGLDPNSPQFEAALEACAKDAPGRGAGLPASRGASAG